MASKKARGLRAKTRRLLKRRNIPSASVNKLTQDFSEGQKVRIKIDPAVHAGMPHARYQGFNGIVVGKQGKMFRIEVTKGGIGKELLVSAVHLDPERSS